MLYYLNKQDMKTKLWLVLLASALFPLHLFAATLEDTSIIDELENNTEKNIQIDYSLKSFDSCEVFEDVIEWYMKTYWENSYKNFSFRNFWEPLILESESSSLDDGWALSKDAVSAVAPEEISETNVQVIWVDEADIVKTDGNYHYYYNQTEQAVFIVQAAWEELELIKKIKLPKSFYWVELYIDANRLAIIASSYSQTDYSARWYFIDRNTKTYSIVFDTQDKENPELIKLYSSDGNYSSSRKIWDYLYVLSTNYFNYPYYNISSVDDIEVDAKKFFPQKLDISKTDTPSEQNLRVRDKDLPYKARTWDIVDCTNISYSFPSEETIKNGGFNPGYNIISVINIKDISTDVTSKVIAGSNSEIYMSLDNLYMTEWIWSANNYDCPPNALCAMPFFWGGTQNTLVHKLNIDNQNIAYQNSALVPWAPLNQYSMDEYNGNFRIITSQWSPERSTGLYVLDADLESVSSLTNLAPGEIFQSSRFIWDKLFLVTFEQIDPLFAIDLSDPLKPSVLWELKIPWFSTYLHPYDENHLIGLWYDTQANRWWGTQTAGVKVDLYKINYNKKCGDSWLTAVQEEKCESGDYKWIIVEQLYTETLGWKWSYSEALNNPRMFVWNQDRNTLLLPATLYEKDDSWNTLDYYNGLFAIEIDAVSGIQVINKTTHIDLSGLEEKREKECSTFVSNSQPVCKELLNGELFCENENNNIFVPNYCFKDASIWSYVGDKSWEFNTENIKRALYIGDTVYALSDKQISSHDWSLGQKNILNFK